MKKILSVMLLCTLLLSCSKDEKEKLMINSTSVSLHSGDTHFITTSNGTNVTFESQNPYIALVNETTGEVTAMTIGTTIIDVYSDQGNAKVEVTVNKQYNTFTEPCKDFTKTRSQIISMYGEPDSETDSGIAYAYDDNVHIADMYIFKNNKIQSSTAIINQDYAIETMKFLLERYWTLGEEDGLYMFVNGHSKETITMAVVMSKMSGYKLYQVMYFPYSSNTRCNVDNIMLEESLLQKFAEFKE